MQSGMKQFPIISPQSINNPVHFVKPSDAVQQFHQFQQQVIGNMVQESNPFVHKMEHRSNSPAQNPNKPTLMPPTMFTATKEESIIEDPLAASTSISSTNTIRPEPLTQNQLLQALNYLLENDNDFMKKIHEAYLKSFNKIVSL